MIKHSKHRRTPFICRIDVTAFAAVMVAILAIFIHPARLLEGPRSPGVDLPKVTNGRTMRGADREDAIIVTVRKDGTTYFGNRRVTTSVLPSLIQDGVEKGAERKVYVNADGRAKYGNVAEVLNSIRSSGLENIAFIVESRPN